MELGHGPGVAPERRRGTPKSASDLGVLGSPYGIRTRAATLRGWCPRPLDERAEQRSGTLAAGSTVSHLGTGGGNGIGVSVRILVARATRSGRKGQRPRRRRRGRQSWGERNRTPNYRTRICCVASYTTPHGAVRQCSGEGGWAVRCDRSRSGGRWRRRRPPAAHAPSARRRGRRWSGSARRGRRGRPRRRSAGCAGRGTGR